MKLKDIDDVERYLKNDCYCEGEIYSVGGFFFRTYKPEDECKLLVKSSELVAVICGNQILIFWEKDNTVYDAIRYDATENNINVVIEYAKDISKGIEKKYNLDKFKDNNSDESLKELLSKVDAVMIG
jgi:hypothetical protein